MKLKEYKKKRNFLRTTEPVGDIAEESSANNFVVQLHRARAKHFDLRLEHKGVLISFAVPKGLSNNPKEKRLAVHVEDHPLDYMNFEGIIPKGNYGAGTVDIFDSGTYIPLEDFDKGLKKGHLKFFLNGEKLKGAWNMFRTDEQNWLAVKIEDQFACAGKKKTKLAFDAAPVQLATLVSQLPKGKDWVFEIKYDGYRICAFVENGKARLCTRNGNDYTTKFPKISKALSKLDIENAVFDGEVVAFDESGRSDFGLLQSNLKSGKNNFFFVVFDLLALDGEDLRALPFLQRKEKLQRVLYKAENMLLFSAHVENGKETFAFAKAHNLEGVIAKKINAPYMGGRSNDWLKIKCGHRQEFVIGGFATSDKNQVLSAIYLGYYENKKLIYVGKVGTGLSDALRQELRQKFEKLARKTCPFSPPIDDKNAVWLKPTLVAEIKYAELTKDNLLRQPSFVGLRGDKPAKDVHLEVKNED
ncbi:MAG: non-homologous end-joining DNA ligase [Clostridia bacterium]